MDFAISGKIDRQYNKEWPPTINAIVVVDHPEHKRGLFLGVIYKYIFDNRACLVILLNNKEYVEQVLVKHKMVENENAAKGVFVLLPSFGWKYANIDKLANHFKKGVLEITEAVAERKAIFESKTVLRDYPLTRLDLMTHGLYTSRNATEQAADADAANTDVEEANGPASLLTAEGEIDLDQLFREKQINLYDPNEEFTPISNGTKNEIKKRLKLAERIDDDEMKIIVNKNIAIRNIIDSQEDEIHEGNKIIQWLTDNVQKTSDVYADLKFAIHNGYVHIGRKGIDVSDKITTDLVPDLDYFKWQYDIPIDYDSLKYIMFQTQYQQNLSHDIQQRREVEKIFSQEYLICAHPQPKYLIWTVKRLIMAWYADDVLTQNIRKIKILINQWRAKSDEPFNNRYGVMPMVVIYPRYGKESARQCATTIADYFVLYNSIAWQCSPPSYFIKINDLLYYTNGNLDLKLYSKRVLKEYHGTVKNTSFDNELKKVIGAENLLYPFV